MAADLAEGHGLDRRQNWMARSRQLNDEVETVEDALESAARRGVDVEVLMTMQAGWIPAFSALKVAGVHIRTYDAKAALYVHAKVIVADSTLAFLGSENFSDASLDDNRELGIIFSKVSVVAGLTACFRLDWLHADPF